MISKVAWVTASGDTLRAKSSAHPRSLETTRATGLSRRGDRARASPVTGRAARARAEGRQRARARPRRRARNAFVSFSVQC